MMVSVRPFEERDAQPLADLMMEMIRFYGATVDPTLVVAEDVVRQSKTIDIIVAQGDEQIQSPWVAVLSLSGATGPPS